MKTRTKFLMIALAGLLVISAAYGDDKKKKKADPNVVELANPGGAVTTVPVDSLEEQQRKDRQEHGDAHVGRLRDSMAVDTTTWSVPPQSVSMINSQRLITSKIRLLARAYGDSIVLRWAPEDYASWTQLNAVGYDILRHSPDDYTTLTTVAHALKPMTEQQFQQRYGTKDSLALVAAAALHGKGQMGANDTQEMPGTLGALVEHSEEQNMLFGYAALVAEWRPDLAEALALRFTDRTAKKGAIYRYIVRPSVWDQDSIIIFEPGIVDSIKNVRFKPEPFTAFVSHEIVDVNTLALSWVEPRFSSYEIERRSKGSKNWTRLNDRPLVPFRNEAIAGSAGDTINVVNDIVPQPGVYEYRLQGYDAFGDLSAPSEVKVVEMPDIEAPLAPVIKGIYIQRPNSQDLMADVKALIHFGKDRLEKDFTGYRIFYRSQKVQNGQWQELTRQQLSPRDTLFQADVVGLPTGDITIAAYDTAMNVNYSLVQEIRLSDLKAPNAPRNLRAETDAKKGTITITWSPSADLDVEHYDLAFANDTTHAFLIKAQLGPKDTVFVDSVALDANQKYIYYKVRATDYSTNIGDYSPWLQVERPHNLPPVPAHLDTAWVTREQIHVEWIVATDADMAYHNVLRRRTDQKTWTLLSRQDADSVALQGYRIRIDDQPEPSRQHRYEYVVESWNTSKLSSDPTPAYSALISESWVLQATLKLAGDYFVKDDRTRLAWSIEGKLPTNTNCYLCVFRKGAGDNDFQYMLSLPITDVEYSDQLLESGEEAEYYMIIQTEDGRSSKPSNTVKVKRGER